MLDLMKYEEISEEKIEKALGFSKGQVLDNLREFTDKFQNAYSVDGFYEAVENTDWTNGFWTGEIWLAYELALEKGDETEAVK